MGTEKNSLLAKTEQQTKIQFFKKTNQKSVKWI